MKKNYSLFCFFFLLSFFISFSQERDKQIDSLHLVLKNNSLIYKERVEVLNKLTLHYGEFDLNKATVINNQIYTIAKKNNFSKGFGYYFQNLANYYIRTNNYVQAELMAKKAQSYFLKLNDINNYLLAIYANCFALDFQDKYEQAKNLALITVERFENKSNNDRIVELYYYLSTIYNEEKKVKISFMYINKALSQYIKNNNTNGIYKCNFQMALICEMNDLNDKTLFYLDKCNALLYSKFVNKMEFHIKLYYVYTDTYIKLKNYKKALFYAKKTESLINKGNFKSFTFENNLDLFIVNTHLKSYNLASYYLAILDSTSNLSTSQLFDLNLAKATFYFEQKQYSKAYFFTKKNHKIDPNSINNLMLLAATAFELKDFKNAFSYQKQLFELKEKEYILEKDNKASEYEVLFQLKEKDISLKNKSLIVANQQTEIQRQKGFVVIFIVIFITLLIVMAILMNSYQIKRKSNLLLHSKNLELKQLNQLVATSLKEKEILLKEIHHRVKNNLQLVMSLLNIQAQDSRQISVEDFLHKGQLRIASISLIHQNLYLTENFANIDFQTYLQNLVENIKNSFEKNNISISIDTQGYNFDIDTAIPLGLIINEIVCNALKHAFPNTQEGLIQISIQKKEDNWFELQIGDNGVGANETKKNTSIGLELVSLLVMQLRGKIEIINKIGTNYSILFKQTIDY